MNDPRHLIEAFFALPRPLHPSKRPPIDRRPPRRRNGKGRKRKARA